MTVKFAPLLCLAALVLSACGTVDDETPQTSVSQQRVEKRVVHGPIVLDGEPSKRAVKKRKHSSTYARSSSRSTRTAAVAPSTTPTRVEPVEAPKVETPVAPSTTPTTPEPSASVPATTADATPPSSTPATPAAPVESAPVTEVPPATVPSTDPSVVPASPVTSETQPASSEAAPAETTPAADNNPQSLLPNLDPAKLPELLQMTFAGLPLWLIILVGLVLIVALAIGFGGRRENEDPV